MSLDNVRGDSSYITVRVVDSRVGDNVLPQVVDADAQAPQRPGQNVKFRAATTRWEVTPLRVEEDTLTFASVDSDQIAFLSPGCRKAASAPVKYTFSCDCLSVSLSSLGHPKDHSSRFQVLLDLSFVQQALAVSAPAPRRVMSASMSIRVIPCGFLSHRAAAFLGHLRQIVILGEGNRSPAFRFRIQPERRRHAADSHLHLESPLFFRTSS